MERGWKGGDNVYRATRSGEIGDGKEREEKEKGIGNPHGLFLVGMKKLEP